MSWYLSVTARTAAGSAWPRAVATPALPTTNASPSDSARTLLILVFTSHLERNFVDIRRRMACALVDAHPGLLRRTGHEAEHLPRNRVEPRLLVMDALLGLDREVATVR